MRRKQRRAAGVSPCLHKPPSEADAQASQEAARYTDCHRDGQVAIVRSGVRGAWSGGEPRARSEAEQQGGSFAPAGPPTRAKDAAVQVSRFCSALFLPCMPLSTTRLMF